ncbi:SUKH-4 family immunity protein [Glycomyces albidus]|nr:SUKH-4 family immunity protein [Glycomyces albidus]
MRVLQEYVKAWGTDNMVRYPRSRWMREFPAPAAAYPGVDFLPVDMPTVFTSHLTGRYELFARIDVARGPAGPLQVVVVGAVPADPEATLFCLDIASGRILMLGVKDRTLELVNSSFKALSEFLYHFALFVDQDTGRAGRARRAAVLRATLAGIDPAAFADPESWWSVTFMQLEYRTA